jgi:hypothetical protein
MSLILQGSTSGSITLQEPAVAGTTVLTLPAVSGNVLTDTSPKAGNVIQVVNATYSTQTTSGSSTYADTGLTATITPTSTTSKILVLVSQSGNLVTGYSTGTAITFRLLRSASVIAFLEDLNSYTAGSSGSGVGGGSTSISYLDSPATTSATTYKTQFSNRAASGTVYIQFSGSVSSMTLMEIAA